MKRNSTLFLLIGMWTSTQINVIGFLGISELVIYLIAPFVYLKNRMLFKRDGMGILFVLLFLTMISCMVSGLMNHNGLVATIKGFASVYGIFACVTVLYPLVRKNPGGLCWLLIGLAISSVICVFIFQPGAAHGGAVAGSTGTELSREDLQNSVTGYALFWTSQINRWSYLPIRAFYLSVPSWYSVLVPFGLSAYALFATASGRSTFLAGMLSVCVLAMGGKSYKSLSRLRKNFTVLIVCLGVGGYVFAYAYKYTAKTGMLGEAAQEKYERQIVRSGRGEGLKAMIMGSRLEFFIGATACIKHPILGCGPKAVDVEGLIPYFYTHYGTPADLEAYEKRRIVDAARGIYYRTIPAHSHIISFWLYYGLVGALLWVYIFWVVIKTFKNYISAIPQWFGYFAMALPGATLSILFSPFGDRLEKALLICCCFVAKNVYEHRIQLPVDMLKAAMRHRR